MQKSTQLEIVSAIIGILSLFVGLGQWLLPNPIIPSITIQFVLMISLLAVIIFGFSFIWTRLSSSPNRWIILAVYLTTVLYAGFVGTQQVAGTNTNDQILPIETMPSTVFDYSGNDASNVGTSSSSMTILQNKNGQSYLLDYTLPKKDDGDGRVGIIFRFSEPQDLTSYEFFEVTINTKDENTKDEPTSLDLIIFDNLSIDNFTGKTFEIRNDSIGGNSNIEVIVKGKDKIFKIPLKIALEPDVNRKFITEIDFEVKNSFLSGHHQFTLSQIRFLKS